MYGLRWDGAATRKVQLIVICAHPFSEFAKIKFIRMYAVIQPLLQDIDTVFGYIYFNKYIFF